MTRQPGTRPWTVYLLVALIVGAAVAGLVSDDARGAWGVVSFLISVGFAYGVWVGTRAVFTMLFMLATLCAGFSLVAGLVQVLLFEEPLTSGLMWTFAASSLWIALLMHPATKRFAGLAQSDVAPTRQSPV